MLKFRVKTTSWDKIEADCVVLVVSSSKWEEGLRSANAKWNGGLISFLKKHAFSAKIGESVSIPADDYISASQLLILGVGKGGLDDARKALGRLGRELRSKKMPRVALDVSSVVFDAWKGDVVGKLVSESISLGAYAFTKYKQKLTKEEPVETEILVLGKPADISHLAQGVADGELFAEATMFARDLVNESPTVTTPTYLARAAEKLAVKGLITVEVLEEAQVRKMGMHAFLSVSRGSSEAPKFIKLVYKGGKRKVVLAGKAITFDTGGLSIKDSKNMETMKLDMAGGAAVLGVFKALAVLKPNVTVIGLIAATENMPGSRATKPGDIVTAMNGKSIEILNTDAEGRMTLADVLSYALQEKPEVIVDVATLTGACMVALGDDIAGLFVNDEKLRTKLLQSAKSEGEKIWELPLEEDYRDSVKSDLADLRNIAKIRYGGAITAALFLEEFVDKTPWAHLDIAGPAFAEKPGSLTPLGGTGFGVRLLLNFLQNY